MALLSQDAPDLMKSRLEQGVWLDQIERAYNAWFAAPNHKKPELLLTGPTLTWAESWMLTQPAELSASLKQYIIRSLTAQSRKSAGQRETIEQEQRRKDKVYRYLLITMSLFALMVLLPGIVRDLLGFQFDQAVPTEVAQGPDFASTPPDTASEPEVAAPAATSPAKKDLEFAVLSRAVQIQADKGDDRVAALLAAEFFESLKAPPVAKNEPALRELARSVVADAFVTRTAPLRDGDRLGDQIPAISCPATARFVGVSEARQVRVWDEASRPAIVKASLNPRQIKAEAVDAACARVVTVSDDYELTVTPLLNGASPMKLGAHEADVVGIGLSGDGSRMVSVSRDSVGKIWDIRAGRRIADLRVDETTFSGAAMSLDGARAVTWSEEQIAHVWDAATGRLLGSLKGHQGPIVRGEFSADNRRILTRSIDGTAILWDAGSMAPLHLVKAETGGVLEAHMSRDGRYVALINEAATVYVFDSASDGNVAEISTGKGKIRSFTFSQDASRLATVDWTGGITVWNTTDGQRLGEVNRRGDPIATVMFSRDGTQLAALAQAGSTATWKLTFEESALQARIKAAGYECLSADERRQFNVPAAGRRPWCMSTEPEPVPFAVAPVEQPAPIESPAAP